MDHFPLNWGKPRTDEDQYNPYPVYGKRPTSHAAIPRTVTQSPIVTGTSVIAIKYKDGIMMAADCLASYGSLARFRDVQRIIGVGNNTIIGASGDVSDFQYTTHLLDQLMTEEYVADDGHVLDPKQIYGYLSNVMYGRRTKMNPLWNSYVIGGVVKGEKGKIERFLGYVDLLGTTYQATTIATGFGAHLAQPLLRKAVEGREDTLTEEEAKKIIEDSMRVLYYRDARSLNKFVRAKATATGFDIEDPISVATNWEVAKQVKGYGA